MKAAAERPTRGEGVAWASRRAWRDPMPPKSW